MNSNLANNKSNEIVPTLSTVDLETMENDTTHEPKQVPMDEVFSEEKRENNKKKHTSKIDLSLKRNFGNVHPFLFIRGEPVFVFGSEFVAFLSTYSMALLITVIFYIFKISHMKFLFKAVYILGFSFFSFCYIFTSTINQGIPKVPKIKSEEELMKYRQCSICNCIMQKDSQYITFHCNICEVCVEDFDHHCPFITKCVGKGNGAMFKVFLFSASFDIFLNLIYIFL